VLSRDCCRYFYHLDVIFFKKTTESFIMRKKDIIASTDAVGVVYESLAANKCPHGWAHGLLFISTSLHFCSIYTHVRQRNSPSHIYLANAWCGILHEYSVAFSSGSTGDLNLSLPSHAPDRVHSKDMRHLEFSSLIANRVLSPCSLRSLTRCRFRRRF